MPVGIGGDGGDDLDADAGLLVGFAQDGLDRVFFGVDVTAGRR